MPPPQASYLSRTSDKGYDPATLSDDESDSDSGSVTSRSTWTSSAAPGDETAILGLVDGLIPEDRLDEELADWKISRVGGLPSFPLTHAPPLSSFHCLSCSTPMPLLLQLYCPLPTSTLERVLYVFSCPRAQCRRKEGAVRVWRANGVWREGRVEEERREREEREREERRERAKNLDLGGLVFASSSSGATPANSANPFNPFAPPTSAASSNPFVLPTSSSTASATASTATATAPASNPFASTSNPFAAPAPPTPAVPVACPSTASPLAQTTSSWAFSSNSTHPSYPAQYLTTMYEPPSSSSSSSKAKAKGKGKERELAKAMELGLRLDADDEGMDFDDEEQDGPRRAGKGSGGRVKKGAPVSAGDKRKTGTTTGGGGEWQKEGYEVQKVKGVDEVFLRFQERVAREGRQVVRYEYGAEPLSYTASSSAYRLLYPSSSSSPDSPGHYSPSRLPPCPSCRSPSTFEAQLMPHLVSLCPDQDWATVWVVSCAAECAGGIEGEGEEEERWREERALVEWEEEAV